jgi:tetratricopeptide (TPR) repeat protein
MMLLNNSYDETRVGLYQMEEIMTLFEDGIREDVSVETCRDSALEMNDYKTLAFPTLRHAVETMSSQDRLRYDPVLILDRFAIREMSDVLDLLQAHIVFPNIREDNNNNEETLFGEDFYLSISSQYRGVPFGNRHGRAYTDLLSGRVKWFLFRPHQLPKHGFDPFESIYEWVYKVYPKLPTAEKPIEFIQEPGQMLIIPEGYYYAYINLAEERSVAIMQVSEEFNLAGKLYYVSEALKRAALAETSEALAFLQMAAHLGGDPWLNYLMGRMHHSVGNLEEAEDQFKRAVAGNLRDPRAYEALISLWQDRRPAEGIEEYPDKDSHTVDALKIALSAGISLRNNFLKKMLSIHDIEMADAPA